MDFSRVTHGMSMTGQQCPTRLELREATEVGAVPSRGGITPKRSVSVWGIAYASFTLPETLDHVELLIQRSEPSYFVTANLHTAMLAEAEGEMRQAIQGAAFTLADGMPMVWASWLQKDPLPERVAGSDLFPALCERAAHKGYRVFLLGGAPGVGDQAAKNLCGRFPGLQIVGVEAPSLGEMTADQQDALAARIRATRPDLLFVALGQPKGELWLKKYCHTLGVPVCAQIGATLDFIAGRVRRAPRWLQRVGLEWAYRLVQEPRRLFLRYTQNALFLFRMVLTHGRGKARQRRSSYNTL